jgi:hypothetical protein
VPYVAFKAEVPHQREGWQTIQSLHSCDEDIPSFSKVKKRAQRGRYYHKNGVKASRGHNGSRERNGKNRQIRSENSRRLHMHSISYSKGDLFLHSKGNYDQGSFIFRSSLVRGGSSFQTLRSLRSSIQPALETRNSFVIASNYILHMHFNHDAQPVALLRGTENLHDRMDGGYVQRSVPGWQATLSVPNHVYFLDGRTSSES